MKGFCLSMFDSYLWCIHFVITGIKFMGFRNTDITDKIGNVLTTSHYIILVVVNYLYQTSYHTVHPYLHDKRLSSGFIFAWMILVVVCGVDLFGGLVVILLGVWVREAHSVCTPSHQKATYTVGWLGCFHGYHYRFLLSLLLQVVSGKCTRMFRRVIFDAEASKESSRTVRSFLNVSSRRVFVENLSVVVHKSKYDVTEPLIKI